MSKGVKISLSLSMKRRTTIVYNKEGSTKSVDQTTFPSSPPQDPIETIETRVFVLRYLKSPENKPVRIDIVHPPSFFGETTIM